ncbi:MAG: T9SS type A sorting domain-containing protein, partial [Cytophaga sp.]|uniref:T9SS type A sorting domain-containing protein n=1 Tax=Cytophaga sp. TaxID=29535 RepID=UPI003F7FD506
ADNGDYTCTVTGICPPIATSLPATLTVSVCTAVIPVDNGLKVVSVYPNPAADHANISITNRDGKKVTVIVYDIQGASVIMFEQIIQSDTELIDLNTADLSQGMYFVQVQFEDELYSDKVEVIH